MSGTNVDQIFLPDNISLLIQSSFAMCYLLASCVTLLPGFVLSYVPCYSTGMTGITKKGEKPYYLKCLTIPMIVCDGEINT